MTAAPRNAPLRPACARFASTCAGTLAAALLVAGCAETSLPGADPAAGAAQAPSGVLDPVTAARALQKAQALEQVRALEQAEAGAPTRTEPRPQPQVQPHIQADAAAQGEAETQAEAEARAQADALAAAEPPPELGVLRRVPRPDGLPDPEAEAAAAEIAGGGPFARQGANLLAARRPEAAIRAFRMSLAQEGPSLTAMVGLGAAHRQMGLTAVAGDILAQAAERWPESPVARNNYGAALYDMRRYAAAESQFRIAAELMMRQGREPGSDIMRNLAQAERARRIAEGGLPDDAAPFAGGVAPAPPGPGGAGAPSPAPSPSSLAPAAAPQSHAAAPPAAAPPAADARPSPPETA